jgi:hypothetical protein
MGIVRDLKDPDGRGRVRVECPSCFGEGEKCWSYWAEVCQFGVGSSYRDGDHGIWWCPVPGERVLVGFIAGTRYGAFIIPGPPWQNEPGTNKQIIPGEARHIARTKSVRDSTKIRIHKTEAGHTWMADDRGEEESMMLVDWTGAGIYWDSQGKEKDVQERKGDPSYFRNAERRGTKTAFAQTSKKPSEIVSGGVGLHGMMDLNGQGIMCAAKDGDGKVIIYACKQNGEPGPSIVLDAKDDSIYFTAGDDKIQIILDGKSGNIRTTRQIILEIVATPMREFISQLINKIKTTFRKYHITTMEDLGQMKPFPEDVA